MNAKILCQSLRGSRAQVLLAFILARQALGIEELRSWTGLKRETLYNAVNDLAGFGLIAKQVGQHGRVTWIPSGDTLQMSEKWTPGLQESTKRTPGLIDSSCSSSSPSIEEQEEEGQESTKRTPAPAVRAALLGAGVREPKASRLAALEWVTVGFVRAHIKLAKKQGHEIGTAIFRIENNWPVDERDKDDRSKYITGKYADFIEH